MGLFHFKSFGLASAVAILGLVAFSQAATVKNPLIYADVPDISVMRVADKYYMVSTTMHLNPGAPIMESTDLANWRTVNYAHQKLGDNDMLNLANGKSTYGDGSWASSIRYKDGVYYVLTPGRSTNKTHLYRTRDIVNGPWSETQLPFYHDPSLHLEDDGRAFIIYGNTNISIIELNADMTGIKQGGMNKMLVRDPASVAGTEFWLRAEGSHLEKINGMYYLFNICTVAGKGRTETVFRSKTLDGNYEGRVFLQDQGVAQGNIFDTPDGKWYAMLFQDNGAVGRVPWLMPMSWKDGWPVVDGGKAPATIELANPQQPGYNMVTSDDFDETALPLEWEWNHNPDNAHWSLTERPGFMRITTGRVDGNIMNVRNQLGQRTFGPKSSAWISMDISGMKDGDIAGLSAFQKNYGYVAVKKDGNTTKFIMVNADGGTAKEIASAPLSGTTAYVRVDCNFTNKTDKATFFYSNDGKSWTALGNTLSMSYTIPHFMGYRFQMFYQATKSAGGHVDFDWFKIGENVNSEIWLNATQDTTPQTPYKEKIAVIPGKIEAENYDVGRQNQSYYDMDFENQGGKYREDGVDVTLLDPDDELKGYAVGYTNAGEWLEYTVNVKKAGKYAVQANVSSGADNSSFRLFVDDKPITDTIAVPNGGSWDIYDLLSAKTTEISTGEHVLKIAITGSLVNIDYVEFCEGESCKDTTTGLREVATGVNLMRNASELLKVFSMTGKFLGTLDLAGTTTVYSAQELSARLKANGYSKGMYLIQSAGVTKRVVLK
jgi:beta-xylosidase